MGGHVRCSGPEVAATKRPWTAAYESLGFSQMGNSEILENRNIFSPDLFFTRYIDTKPPDGIIRA